MFLDVFGWLKYVEAIVPFADCLKLQLYHIFETCQGIVSSNSGSTAVVACIVPRQKNVGGRL